MRGTTTNVYTNIAAPEEVNSPEITLQNFVSNGCSLVDYVAHNLESFVVPLMPIRKIHTKKSNGNKTVKIVATRKEENRTLLTWIHTNL